MSEKLYKVKVGDKEYTAKVIEEGTTSIKVEVEGQVIEVQLPIQEPHAQKTEQTVRKKDETREAQQPVKTPPVKPASQPETVPVSGKVIKSSVPGKVVEILKSEGESVSVNETVLKMESMKMIIEVKSPYAGRIKRVMVKPGEYVNPGTPLVELE